VTGSAVEVEVQNGVAIFTLTSPPANALGSEVIGGIAAGIEKMEESGAKSLVLASTIPKFFAAGADLKLISGFDADGFREYLTGLRGVLERLAALPLVSIAAIDGYALGGGLELAMACTLRVATARSKLGVPEIKLGLLPGAGGTQRLPRLIGRGRALDLLLTGRNLSGEEAFAVGLVDRIASADQVVDVARELATAFAAGAGQANAAIVRCVDAAYDLPFAEGMEVEGREIADLFVTPDAQEGVAAFVEKRAPRFS